MRSMSPLVLIPFIVACLLFGFRFYSRERAASMVNLSFILAVVAMVLSGLYLGLAVTDLLSPAITIDYGIVGLILLGVSILRLFMI